MTEAINFGELLKDSGGAFEPLPKGEYDFTITGAEATKSSTQKVMFKITMAVVGGPYNGRTVYNNITLTTDNPNALRMFFMNMKAMGLTEEFFAANPAPTAVAEALVGNTTHGVIDHREWQGQMRDNVKTLKPAVGIGGGGISAPPAPGPVSQSGVPSIPQSAPVAPAPAAAPAPAPAAATPPPPPVEQAPVLEAAPAAPAPLAPPATIPQAVWDTMPREAQEAVLAAQAPAPVAAAAAAPAQTAVPAGIVPPPPAVF